MILPKIKQKIKKFLSYLINNKAFISLIFSLFVLLLAASIWLFFPVSSSGVHYYSLGLYILLLLAIVIFTSYKKDISIPIVKTVLKREHHRTKTKQRKKNRKSIITKTYLKTLHYLILLFKNSQDSFEDLKEDLFDEFAYVIGEMKGEKNKKSWFTKIYLKVFYYFSLLFKSSGQNFGLLKNKTLSELNKLANGGEVDEIEDEFKIIKQTINKIKKKEKVDKNYLKELEKELFEFNKIKQKKATVFSLTAITAIIVVTVASGLISSFLFPEVFKTRAASYGLAQTSWSGGSSAATALHPGDQTNWNKYFSKDNISTSTPTELRLSLEETTIWSETSDADWQTHATSSTYYSGDSVGIQKPNGVTCSAALECISGFCVDGYCCNTACTGSTCQVCDGDSNAGAGTCGYVDTVSDPDSECGTANCGLGNCKGDAYACGWLTSGSGNCTTCQTCVGATSESCVAATTNWNASLYDCSGTDKRCVGGVCRDCSDNGGLLRGDGCGGCAGQGGSGCWYFGSSTGQSCDTICTGKGGCVAQDWNSDTGCATDDAVCGGSNILCQQNSNNAAPATNATCSDSYYRNPGSTQNCNATGWGTYIRLCVCNY